MIYRITKTISALLLFAGLIFICSCNDSAVQIEQAPTANYTKEDAIKELEAIIAARGKEKQTDETIFINGKTAADYLREWQQSTGSRGACDDTPNCPKAPFTGVFNFNTSCDFEYSYNVYNCGSGNLAIFDFQMSPVVGSNCSAYEQLVTIPADSCDITNSQKWANVFATILLNDFEDNLFNAVQSPVGQTLIASYIPNICAYSCEIDNCLERECGEDCCIRFAIYDNATGDKQALVFSAGECGGNDIPCSATGQLETCKNFNCPELGVVR